ncbi:hypothetical protein [Paraburkholderia phenoliruptrix]|uniref:hypothetical protein n=1 Tax=Paraburkholderia phenoliruptrix TaxID=252970 RepID=UPI001C6ECB0D|nr:hypothetical protein [Paraburkholderia phenoliruptrix]MBW9104924.1 hypothetical protein [Paraburkholderia phenoliruptrix]MBW9131950.1 hypothetical protein [Paraburkholderia ginsengiterrae]
MIRLGDVFGSKRRKVVIDEKRLAFYMGYAFSHAIQVQHVRAPGELTVPYVVYWDNETPTPVPYPAATQHEAIANAQSAREQTTSGSGWSSGREGTISQSNGAKMDVLVIEGWVPGLDVPLEVFVYCRRDPFRLIQGFLWKTHAQARKDGPSFMAEFKRGILVQPFGQNSMEVIDNAERVQFVS